MTLQIQITPYEYALACVGQCLRSHRPRAVAEQGITAPPAGTAPAAQPAPEPPAPEPAELDLTC